MFLYCRGESIQDKMRKFEIRQELGVRFADPGVTGEPRTSGQQGNAAPVDTRSETWSIDAYASDSEPQTEQESQSVRLQEFAEDNPQPPRFVVVFQVLSSVTIFHFILVSMHDNILIRAICIFFYFLLIIMRLLARYPMPDFACFTGLKCLSCSPSKFQEATNGKVKAPKPASLGAHQSQFALLMMKLTVWWILHSRLVRN